jgi:hypothetical protein
MKQMYQISINEQSLNGKIGTKSELIRRCRSRRVVVASPWDDKTIPLYFSRDCARRDETGARAIGKIEPILETDE